jgi:hypothetical protein
LQTWRKNFRNKDYDGQGNPVAGTGGAPAASEIDTSCSKPPSTSFLTLVAYPPSAISRVRMALRSPVTPGSESS